MAVEAAQIDMRKRERKRGYLFGLSRLYCRTEFGIHLTRCNSGIGVRVYTGGKTKQNLLGNRSLGGNTFYSIKLFLVIRNEISDAVIYSVNDILVGLII